MNVARATALFFLGALSTARAGAFTWIVPGVASTPGEGGALYISGCAAVNTDNAEAATVTVDFIPGLGTLSVSSPMFSIPPRATKRIGHNFGGLGTAALRVTSDKVIGLFCEVFESSRFVPLPEGLGDPILGGRLPVIEESRLLAPGEVGHSAWVSHSGDPSKGDRTNVAVVFPDAAGGAATVTLFDGDGLTLTSRKYDVASPVFLQERLDAFTSRAVPIGRIQVEVTRGRAYGYSAVADNLTGDVAFFPTDRLASEGIDALSSGVAHTSAWRTDVRISNPGHDGILLTADLLGAPPNFFAPRAALSLLPGQTLEIRDALATFFSAPSGTTGAVLWRSSAPVIVLARTGSPGGAETSGFKSGTLETTPLSSFLAAGDPPAVIGGLERTLNTGARLIVSAGLSGADYGLELFDYTGGSRGIAQDSLPPLGWKQVDLATLFPFGSADDSLRVTVRSGSLDAQASVTEFFSAKDPFFLNAVPAGTGGGVAASPIPVGLWGSPDGLEGLRVTEAAVFVERHCAGGVFTQPLRLDSTGRFEAIGIYTFRAPAPFSFRARFSGQTDGHVLALAVFDEEAPDLLIPTALYTLAKPYTVPPDFCPIEY